MEKRIAHFISYVFHPLLMPTYGLAFLFKLKFYFFYSFPFEAKLAIIAIVFLNTAFMPSLFFLFLRYRKVISSLKMENKNERIIPFIITAVFYYGTFYILRRFNLPPLVYYLIFGSFCLIIISLIINFWWKISIHTIAIGGLTGAFIAIGLYLSMNLLLLVALCVFVAGCIGFARLKLMAHTPAQVYMGFLLGVFFMSSFFYMLSF